jgi:hypothetical protein
MLNLPARGLSAASLLTAWEKGWRQTPTEQALAMLAAAYPEVPAPRLAELSIGRRDSCLIALRAGTFGPHIEGETACPRCAERLELEFETEDVRADPPQTDGGQDALSVSVPGWKAVFRLPTSLDLQAAQSAEPSDIRGNLLRRCVTDLRRGGERETVDKMPEELVEAIGERMERADPQAEVRLNLVCPSCGQEWSMLFDIAQFFWGEINARAYRLLYEVHRLASAYGWSEADILALSPWRRQAYLEMVSG